MDPPRSGTALGDPPCVEQRGGAARTTAPFRFLSAAWSETTAAFGVAYFALLAFGIVTGVAYLIGAAELSGAPLILTSEFLAQHIAEAFRVPAYLIVIHCGGEIAHRDGGTANILVASKVAASCVVVFAALTAFGIAAFVAQIASGQPALDLAPCAYALYINFGWHIFVLGAVSVAIQVTLRNAIRICPAAHAPAMVDVLRSKWLGMLIVAAVFLALWVLGEEYAPLGPPPAYYSGMNGYGHDLERFYAWGIYWTAFAVLLVLATHAWTCRDGCSRTRWLAQGVVNVGAPAVATWAAMGCWIYYNANMLDPHAMETDHAAWRAEREQRYKPYVQRGVPHVVAMDLAVDVYPTERRFESRGSMLLANTGAEPIGELLLLFPRGARVDGIDIPNTSVVEHSMEFGLHRYVFARPLRVGERVRMRFELAWEQRGFGSGGRSPRLIENGTFIEGSNIVPSFGHGPALEGKGARTTRIRAVIGTSLDQVAVGPGILLREWKENARRYFEYARSARAAPQALRSSASGSVWPAFSIHSARYAVARDRWNDTTVEVYYHPDHHRNVGSIFRCVGQALDHLAPSSPLYPDQLLRVVEFPYAGEARVFPDAILFSERSEFAFDLLGGLGLNALCASVAGAIARQHGTQKLNLSLVNAE